MSLGEHIDGWMSPSELNWLNERAKEMKSIVEIGCWKGRSTYALLSGCPGIVYCVDHFLGSSEHQGMMPGLNLREEFLSNMKPFKKFILLHMRSNLASKVFQDGSVEMVFIDGSHEKEYVLEDLQGWVPKATKLICGHDKGYQTVQDALDDYFGKDRTGFESFESIWYKRLS